MPCLASIALLAVTTPLPLSSAARTLAWAGAVLAADQLDEHVDGVGVRQADRIVVPGDPVDGSKPRVAGAVARAHGDNVHGAAELRGDGIALPLQEPHDRRAHGPQPRNAEPERFVHKFLSG